MSTTDWIGSTGVFILLLAFLLEQMKIFTSKSWGYLLMNFFGAAISGVASYMIPYWPFVILELAWCGVAVFGMMKKFNSVS